MCSICSGVKQAHPVDVLTLLGQHSGLKDVPLKKSNCPSGKGISVVVSDTDNLNLCLESSKSPKELISPICIQSFLYQTYFVKFLYQHFYLFLILK